MISPFVMNWKKEGRKRWSYNIKYIERERDAMKTLASWKVERNRNRRR